MNNQEPHGPDPSRSGIGGDLRRMRENGAASVAELREFMGELKGRPPQEVLGVIAQSGLTRGLVTATFLMMIVLMVGTVVPYGLNKLGGKEKDAGKAANSVTAPVDDAKTDAKTDVAKKTDEMKKSDEDFLDKLGHGTKKAPANFNPLDGKVDDIFKNLGEK